MKIGIDIDNVISNFDEQLLDAFLKHDKTLRNSGVINSNVYITKGMFDWTKDEQQTFYDSVIENIAKNLKVKPYVKEGIDTLKSLDNEIYIVTGRNNGEYSDPINMTKSWLKDNNIYCDKLIFTNSNDKKSKVEICRRENIDLFIEDTLSIAREFKDSPVDLLLMDTPYNRNENNLKRVYNFNDVVEYVKGNLYLKR